MTTFENQEIFEENLKKNPNLTPYPKGYNPHEFNTLPIYLLQ